MSVSCTGKIRFETFAGANRAARRARRGKGDRALRAYACRECHGFHVGSSAKTPASRQRRASIGGYGRRAHRLSEDDLDESG